MSDLARRGTVLLAEYTSPYERLSEARVERADNAAG